MKKIILTFSLIALIPTTSCAKIITLSIWTYVYGGVISLAMMNYYPYVPPKPVYASPNYAITIDNNYKAQWGSYWAVSADGTMSRTLFEVQVVKFV